MYEKAQTLTARTAAGVLGAVMAVSLVFGAFVPASQAQTLDELMAQIAALQSELNSLSGNSSSTSTGGYVNHPNVDFMFNADLTVGSKGNDVMMLQKALNDGGWTVATTGAGSKGLESTTFGPATKAAVAKFQVAKGITPAAGYFGPKTRMEFNKKGGSTGTSTVTGDKLVASEGNDVDSMDIAPGQRRVLFTTLELSAGDKDVTVDEIHVEVEGEDSDSDKVVEKVLVWDENGVVWDEDAPDSDDMAELVLDGLEIADGKSVTLYIGANIETNGPGNEEDDQDTSLTVVAIEASSPVDGLPVTGAEHVLNDALELTTYDFDVDNENGTAQVGDEEEMVATINVNNDSNDDSIFVNSFTLEQVGNISTDDLENIMVWVDGDEDNAVEADVDGDWVSFTFDDAVEIEEGEDMDFEIYVDIVDGGSTDTIGLAMDDSETDINIVDEDDRVLAVDTLSDDSGTHSVDVNAGEGSSSNSSDVTSGNIAVGQDEAEMVSFDLEVEGEDITGDMTITIAIANATALTADDVELDNVTIVDEEGNEIASADDITVTGAAPNFTLTAEFEDVTFPATDEEVAFVVLADISDDVIDDVTYTTNSIAFTSFEGDDSGDTVAITTVTPSITQTVKGALLNVTVSSSVDDDEIKDDEDEVEIALVQLDASDSGEEITVNEVEVTVTLSAGEDLDQVTNCALYNGDEKVSDEEDFATALTTTGSIAFDLDDVMVASEEVLALSLRCDLSDNFEAADTIAVSTTAPNLSNVDADAETSDDVTIGTATSVGPTITVVDGTLTSDEGAEPDMETARAGNTAEISLGSIEIDSDDVSGPVEEMTLEISGTGAADLLGSTGLVKVYKGSTHVANAYFTTGTTFEIDSFLNGGIVLENDKTVELEFKAKLASTIAVEGQTVAVNLDNVQMKVDGDLYTVAATTLSGLTVYSALPTVAKATLTETDLQDNIIAKFAITAEGDDLDIIAAAMTATRTVTGAASVTLPLVIYTGSSYSDAADESTVLANFTIDEGETEYFVVKGTAVSEGETGDVIETTIELTGAIEVNGMAINPVEGASVNTTQDLVIKYTN